MFEYAIAPENIVYYVLLAVVLLFCMAAFFPIRFRRDHLAVRITVAVVLYLAIMFFCYTGVAEYFLPEANRPLFMVIATAVLCGTLMQVSLTYLVIAAMLLYYVQQFIITVVVFLLLTVDAGIAWGVVAGGLLVVIAFVALWFLFVRRARKEFHNVRVLSLRFFLIYVVSFIIALALYNLLKHYDHFLEVDGFVCYVAWVGGNILLICTEYNRSETEYTLQMQKLLDQEKEEQYKAFKTNIEILNVKCHDLKRYTRELQASGAAGAGGMDVYLSEIGSALDVYDCISNTGNGDLDAVLSEKKHICDLSGIAFGYVIDASDLSFMSGLDIHMLFDNALGNAIEASQEEEEGERIISARVGRRGGMMYISVWNRCSKALKFADGLPVTTKSDSRYHGYGTLSIRRIAKKYGGNAEFSLSGGYFRMNAIIPVPETAKEGSPA